MQSKNASISMRVISGKHKSRIIHESNKDDIRSTKSKVRGAVFDILQFSIEGSVFLDLFSGTGSVGIEALSRGATKAYFVDSNPHAITLIKKNTSYIEDARKEILEKDYKIALKHIEQDSVDIIYVDPPYFENDYVKIVETLYKSSILKEDAIIVLEHSTKTQISLPTAFEVYKTKKYGATVLSFVGIR